MRKELNAIHLPGLRLDNLGNYIATLGLLQACAGRWPDVRCAWRAGHPVLLAPALTYVALEEFILNDWQPRLYEKWWSSFQKLDTKTKSSLNVLSARGTEPDLERVRLLDCHIVGIERNQFNPVVGTGGNVGKRVFAKAFSDAKKLLGKSDLSTRTEWLKTTLRGTCGAVLPELAGAGTWFVYSSKTFNSGQKWYREGRISPWAVLLALEGIRLLQGGVSKRMGSRSRPYAVFPFVSNSPSPASQAEIGMSKAEFWAPVWDSPANLVEVRVLFERGLAKVGNASARSPHEFAVSARAAGTDGGVVSFVRFSLRQTTSSQVYEAIPLGSVQVAGTPSSDSSLIAPLLPWLNALPSDPFNKQSKRQFSGLRSPVESAIIDLTQRPDSPEGYQRLLAVLANVQSRVDNNLKLRDQCRPVPLLDPSWFDLAWPAPSPELLVARAIASVGAASDTPLQANVFGVVSDKYRRLSFTPGGRPQRAVWHYGSPTKAIADVLERRLVEAGPTDPLPLGGPCRCPASALQACLSSTFDWEEVGRWIPSLCLIGWRSGGLLSSSQTPNPHKDGLYLIQSYFRPFFQPGLELGTAQLRTGVARRILSLIRAGAWQEAASYARTRYMSAGRQAILPILTVSCDPDSLAAALLIPVRKANVVADLERWLLPVKENLK